MSKEREWLEIYLPRRELTSGILAAYWVKAFFTLQEGSVPGKYFDKQHFCELKKMGLMHMIKWV